MFFSFQTLTGANLSTTVLPCLQGDRCQRMATIGFPRLFSQRLAEWSQRQYDFVSWYPGLSIP